MSPTALAAALYLRGECFMAMASPFLSAEPSSQGSVPAGTQGKAEVAPLPARPSHLPSQLPCRAWICSLRPSLVGLETPGALPTSTHQCPLQGGLVLLKSFTPAFLSKEWFIPLHSQRDPVSYLILSHNDNLQLSHSSAAKQ